MSRRSGFDAFVESILALLILGGGSIALGEWVNERYGLFPARSPLAFFVGIGLVLAVVCGIVLAAIGAVRVYEWRKSWAKCFHGVDGGETRNRCDLCVRNRRKIEEDLRRQ